jgi:hypothetical protein
MNILRIDRRLKRLSTNQIKALDKLGLVLWRGNLCYTDDAKKLYDYFFGVTVKGGVIDALAAKLKTFKLETSCKKQATDTPPTITLSTLRTSAGIFRRVGISA